MKIKICGIRTKKNLSFLNQSAVEFVGFIFYEPSKRFFLQGDLTAEDLRKSTKKKVGVFVNHPLPDVEETAAHYRLDYLQLHGEESPSYCAKLKEKGYAVIKAFGVHTVLPTGLVAYQPVVDYFLFDTKGDAYGGHGVSFDWGILQDYRQATPFFLSGGIAPTDVEKIKNITHPQCYGLDLNSCFEISPGVKDDLKIQGFIRAMR